VEHPHAPERRGEPPAGLLLRRGRAQHRRAGGAVPDPGVADPGLDLRPGHRRHLRLPHAVLPGPAPRAGGGGEPPAVPLAAADRRAGAPLPAGHPAGREPPGGRRPGPGRGCPGGHRGPAQPRPGPPARLPPGPGRGPGLVQLLPAHQARTPLPHRRRGRLLPRLGPARAGPARPGTAGRLRAGVHHFAQGLAVPGAARAGPHGRRLLHLGRGPEARRPPGHRRPGLPHAPAFDPAAGPGRRPAPDRAVQLRHGAHRGRRGGGLPGPPAIQGRPRCRRRRHWPWFPRAWP